MKFITLETLTYFKTKLEGLFVAKEKKTGSDTEYRVLSDNNLTDALLQKINDAGTSSFSGSYTALTDKPTVNGHEVDGTMTLADLGIDKVSAFTNDAKYQTDAEVAATASTAKAEAVDAAKTYTDTTASTAKTEAIADAKAYTDTEVGAAETAAVSSAKTYTDTEVAAAKTSAVSDAKTYTDGVKTELETTINAKIATAYKVKGSTAFASLPALAGAEEGNVYNITDAFSSTADFVEGTGKKYAAGTNVVCVEASKGVYKWDVLAGFIDTDVFVKNSDIESVTNADIDALFAAA